MSEDPTIESPNQPDAEQVIDPQITNELTHSDPAPPKTPAGWYPTPDGRQRYWDGSRWTDLPWDEGDATVTGESTGPVPRTKWTPQRRKRALIEGATVVIILGLLAGGIALKGAGDRQVAAAKIAKIHTAERLAATEKKNAADAADAAAEAQRVKDDAERTARTAEVTGIEASVKTLAEKDVTDKLLVGPILSVKCSPVGSGSTSDLTQLTSVFECFAANKDNGDGTQSGYTFHANMNWSDGSYTYGLGKANG
jgi:hypothetical protein